MRRRQRSSPLDCTAVGRLLQAFLDDEVDEDRAAAVAAHLGACLDCGMDAATYRWLKAEVAGLARVGDPQQVERIHAFADALVDGTNR